MMIDFNDVEKVSFGNVEIQEVWWNGVKLWDEVKEIFFETKVANAVYSHSNSIVFQDSVAEFQNADVSKVVVGAMTFESREILGFRNNTMFLRNTIGGKYVPASTGTSVYIYY